MAWGFLQPAHTARAINVSYPTLKQWIYKGKIRSIRTPGGHHRIPASEVERIARGRRRPARLELDRISGRNKLLGTVTEVRYEGLLAQVTLDVGGQPVVSIITRGACEELGLRPGTGAYALIKATEVMIVRA